MLGLPEVSWL